MGDLAPSSSDRAWRASVDLPPSARAAIEALARYPGIRTIIVFGSRANGDHDPRSDVDVAIEAQELDRATLARIRDHMAHFPTLYRISVTVLDTMPNELKQRVLAQGTRIYERTQA